MAPLRLSDEDAAALRALILLQRYSLGITQVADRALGDIGTDNTDMQLLLFVGSGDGVSPSEVVSTLGRPRSTVSRGLARLLSAGLVERSTSPGDRRRAELHLTPRGRAGIERFEQSLSDFFRASEPIVKEVMLLLGRDPERARGTEAVPGPLELADQLSAAGASYGQELLPRMHAFGANETVDRFALMVLAQAWARPSWLADELALSPAGTTSLLERLESAGLAVRESGALETDRRAVVVHLTARGRRAARVLLEVFRRYQETLLDGLAPTLAHGGADTAG